MLTASLVTSAGNCAAAVSKITCRKRSLAVRGIALRFTITTSAQGGSATSARTTAAPTCPVPPMIKTRNAILDLFLTIFGARSCCSTIVIDSDQSTQTGFVNIDAARRSLTSTMRAQAVTSKSHVRQNRGRVDICRQTHLPPLCGLSFPRLLGFSAEANRVAADQQVRRKAVTRRQTEHNLSHLDGIADLFTPIRFQGLGNSANGRFIVGEEFGRVLVRAGTPVRPHSAGFKGANLHRERGQFLGKRFRKAPNSPFRCMVRRAARSGQAAADRRYLEDAAAPLLAHVRYGRTGDVNDAIEVGVNHRLQPLRAQLLERRNIAEPGVINDHVETPKRVKCYLHGGLSRAFIRHVKGNRADALAEFIYQVIQSSRVPRCGD